LLRLIPLVIFASAAIPGFGQDLISAKSGVIHYVEGDVKAAGEAVATRTGGKYTEMKDGQELTTGEGRVEVLLNPGVFLRVGENSRVQMISTRLTDTRLELAEGSALIEVAEMVKDNAVTVLVKNTALTFEKTAMVYVDAASAIRVYKGQVQATVAGADPVNLKEGREMLLDGSQKIAKFDTKDTDPLYRWAARRAEYIAMANIASANMARQAGRMSYGGWFYNSYYGMMTYLPFNGLYRSPFGYVFYSPRRVDDYYGAYLPVYRNPDNGFSNNAGNAGPRWSSDNGYYVNSRAGMASPSTSAPAAAPSTSVEPAPSGRGADAVVGRGGGGGGPQQ
jgi:hypothetical protein